MARTPTDPIPDNPNPPDPNEQVPCPRGCGYRVAYKSYGAPHKILDPDDPKQQRTKTCQ